MTTDELKAQYRPLLTKWARQYFLEADVVIAMAEVETCFRPLLCRYEPKFRYLFSPEIFARHLDQSVDTEKAQQMTSWGMLQVMGAVARECGFTGPLTQLAADTELGLQFAVIHLFRLRNRYPNGWDYVAAYNAGSPRRNEDGTYVNQRYVDEVLAAMNNEVKSKGVLP